VRVLLVNLLYEPDLGPSAPLMAMLCEDLVRLGHELTTIAAVPHYPTGRVPAEYRSRLVQTELRNGVRVIRVWVPSVNRARLSRRFLTFLAYQALAAVVGLRLRYDVVIATNPALEVFLPYFVLGVLRRKPLIFSVHDIYPDVGVELGIFRRPILVKAVETLERFCLNHAVFVRVLSDGFQERLELKGVPEGRLKVVWDWVDTDFIRPQSRANPFSSRWGIDRCFAVMYAGNLGLSQPLERLVEAARLLAGQDQIRFVFVGEGSGKERLVAAVQSAALSSVSVIPAQTRQLLPQVLASADVSLVALKRGLSRNSVPSKCYSIMASARPVIASVDEGSDTWNLVEGARCGLCVPPEDPDSLAEAIWQLYQNPGLRARLGADGRAYVEEHHSRRVAAAEFDRLLRAAVDGKERVLE